MSRKYWLTLVPLVLFFVGCGGGSGESADGGGEGDGSTRVVTVGSLDKTQFVSQVNALCLRDQTQLYEEATAHLKQESHGSVPSPGVYKETLETILIPGFESQIETIEKLGAPQGEEGEVGAFLTSWQQALDRGRTLAPKETTKLEQYLMASGKLAKEYGVGNCAFP